MGIKKIATNLPEDLLLAAVKVTGLNMTHTIIEGLKELIAREHRQDLLKLKGKIAIHLDVGQT